MVAIRAEKREDGMIRVELEVGMTLLAVMLPQDDAARLQEWLGRMLTPFGHIAEDKFYFGYTDGGSMTQEYCDRCDGCGWYEGGATLNTTCEKCGGTGIVPAAPAPPYDVIDPDGNYCNTYNRKRDAEAAARQLEAQDREAER